MAYTPIDWNCGDTLTAEKMNKMEQAIGEINMSYEPTVWECGDIITAEKLNKMEEGIANCGGGGSSDFSTAEVTIINNADTPPEIDMPIASPETPEPFPSLAIARNLGLFGDAENTVTVILYKGSASFELPPGTQFTVSGNIEKNEILSCGTITGDGTITIS